MSKAWMFGLLISVAFVVSAPARAEEERSADYGKCMDKAAGVTSETIDCTRLESDRVDAEMNRLWKISFPKLDPSVQGPLRTAQRDWLKFQESHCTAAVSPFEGSSVGIIYNDCMLELRLRRTRELKDFFDNLADLNQQ